MNFDIFIEMAANDKVCAAQLVIWVTTARLTRKTTRNFDRVGWSQQRSKEINSQNIQKLTSYLPETQ
jgi:hypothetical protein